MFRIEPHWLIICIKIAIKWNNITPQNQVILNHQSETERINPSTVVIEGKNIRNIPSFYEEINRVFMQGDEWQIGDSLDAFNDMLYGGYGILKHGQPTELIWNDVTISRKALGFEATKNWYKNKLQPGSPFNKEYHQEKLLDLELGKGETFFEIVLEIIREHQKIKLTMK